MSSEHDESTAETTEALNEPKRFAFTWFFKKPGRLMLWSIPFFIVRYLMYSAGMMIAFSTLGTESPGLLHNLAALFLFLVGGVVHGVGLVGAIIAIVWTIIRDWK